MLSQVVELIEAKRRFAITSHIRPDGDSLGSSLGLYWLLRALDKDVEVIMRDPVPHAYQQLPGANDVRVTRESAEWVYTALITDTGSFHYSNTTERTFKVASELVRTGVKPAKTAEAVFASYPWSRIQLMGAVLSTARRDESGRVACMRQSAEMQRQAQASDEDADGFVNYPLTVGEVEAVALLKECEPGVYRTSLRSKGDVNVAKVAEKFGGGGHRNAAGCTLRGSWEEAETTIVALLQDAVKRANGARDITEDALKETESVI